MNHSTRELNGDSKKLKIAVIGGGISGLSAAWLLSQKHQVTLYESQSKPGLYAEEVDLQIGGRSYNCDIPGRIMVDRYYTTLLKLCEYLKVELQQLKPSASFLDDSLETYFSYTALGRLTWPSSWKWKHIRTARFWKRIYAYILFISSIERDVDNLELDKISFKEYMEMRQFKYADSFYKEIIAGYNITLSCNNQEIENCPARIIVHYLFHLFYSRVYRIKGGTKNLAAKLTPNVTMKMNSPVEGIHRKEDRVSLVVNGSAAEFDAVVFATSPASTLHILGESATLEEKDIFNSFSYAKTKIWLHTDKSVQKDHPSMLNVLVSDKLDHAPFHVYINLALTDEAGLPLPHSDTFYFQTFNPVTPVDDRLIIKEAHFSRIVLTLNTQAVLEKLHRIQGERQTWYCGAYSLYSAHLLEDGVKSAIGIAKQFGVSEPWATS